MLYVTKPHIGGRHVNSLINETRKRSNQEEQEGSSLVVTGRKGREEEKKSGIVEGMSLLSQSQGRSFEE